MSIISQPLFPRSLLAGPKLPRRWEAMSPLRYPGSKRKLIPAIRQLLDFSIPKPDLFVEPFCGGASVTLGLLEANSIERAIISDLDPLIAAFWIEATSNADRLIDDMYKEPITVERWDYWRISKPRSTRKLALKCIFLNRTTFSGIVGGTAGPIGGRSQTSKYRIDCRFPKESLALRILNIKRFAIEGRILEVKQSRWQDTMAYAQDVASKYGSRHLVFYLDPPYIEKANRLYDRPFKEEDHNELARYLTYECSYPWILSYDDVPVIRQQYRGHPSIREYGVSHQYTMTGNRCTQAPGRELLFTTLNTIPA